MSRYRKIDVRIWGDAKFARFTDHGKLGFFYILTHPGLTALGAMRATLPGLAAELGWPERVFRAAIGPAIEQGMVEVDERAAFVGLPHFLRYNEPESPNVVKGWTKALDLIPECPARRRLLQRVAEHVEGLSEGFRKAFREAFAEALAEGFAEPSPNQEQEQEQEPPCSPPRGTRAQSRERTTTGEAFETFWAAYPRKVAKEAARRAWAKLAPGNGLVPVLLAALDRQTQSEAWTRDSGRFIPHASTWLNGQRWQDEVPEADAESDPATRLVCYSARDFDADGELKPEADARERARLAALRGAREPAR